MNLRKKLAMSLIAAGLFSAGGAAQAAIDNFASGDSSVLLSLFDSTTQVSALFDLGLNLSSLYANANTAGYSLSFDLTQGNYATAYNSLLSAGATAATLRWNVIAGDSTGASATAQSSRYLSTTTNSFSTTSAQPSNAQVINWSGADVYLNASNLLGNHGTVADGADQVASNAANAYFGNGFGGSGNWRANANFTSLAAVGTAQSFYYFANTGGSSNAKAVRQAFGADLDNNGSIGAGEFGQFNVSSAGLVTFANPVPEADTWAMFAAGLIAVGAIARRRLSV